MTRRLCAGRDPEWWTPNHEQARLATLICGVCHGCPDNDPAPAGVIRDGVAYSDCGSVIPACPSCQRPNDTYRGGIITRCSTCAIPDVRLPNAKASRRRWIAALSDRLPTEQVAVEAGITVRTVWSIRYRYGRRTETTTTERKAA
jgi:hypothetical protein